MSISDIVWLAALAAIPGVIVGKYLASLQREPVRVPRQRIG
ncbi:MAG TPA: hypothetical protein VMT79_14565 [Candidatus Binatia bacterium]|nr:hypothetical protein [Candidatus Binatia bacterium]